MKRDYTFCSENAHSCQSAKKYDGGQKQAVCPGSDRADRIGKRTVDQRREANASYTVELALLLPLILLTMLLPIYAGYRLYGEGEAISACSWDEELSPENQVRNLKFAKEAWEDLK